MNTNELVEALQKSKDDISRYLKLKLNLPASTIITLPPGPHGLLLEDNDDGICHVIGVTPGYSRDIRVGMLVDGIETSDGLQLYGHPTKMVLQILDQAQHQSERIVKCISPESKPSPKSKVLPSFKTHTLPPGTAAEVGLQELGDNCTIASSGSRRSYSMPSGFRVYTLTLPDLGHSFRNVTPDQLMELLNVTSDESNRIVTLKNPDKLSSKAASSIGVTSYKLRLPDEGNAEQLGLVLEDTSDDGLPIIADIDSSSPLAPYLMTPAGVVVSVTKIGWDGTTEFEGLDASDLKEVLGDSSGFPQRMLYCTASRDGGENKMILKRGDAPSVVHSVQQQEQQEQQELDSLPTNPSIASAAAAAASSSSLPDELLVELPKGKVGAIFAETPPQLTKLAPDSVLREAGVPLGMTVDTLTLTETGQTYTQLETMEFVNALKGSADQEGRLIRFINVDKVPLTVEEEEEEEDDMNVPLGSIGGGGGGGASVQSGKSATSMRSSSAGVSIPKSSSSIKSARSKASSVGGGGSVRSKASGGGSANMMIPLNSPSSVVSKTTSVSGSVVPEVVPEETEFEHDQHEIEEALQEIHDLPEEIQQLDEIQEAIHTLENLEEQYENENENTAPEEEEDEEDEEEEDNGIELLVPAGPIGLSFSKDTPPIVKKVRDTSPLVGMVEPGMLVDTVELMDIGETYYELDGAELANLLKDNKDSSGRKVRFITADMELTPKPGGAGAAASSVAGDSQTTGQSVYLPVGKLGMSFVSGDKPPAIINKIKPDGPLEEYRSIQGMAIDTLEVPGDGDDDVAVHYELNAREVTSLLKATADTAGRKLRVRRPVSEKFHTLPDEMSVVVPPGSLLCSLGGRPPKVKSFKEGSPLADKIPPAMFVDGLALPDGYVKKGLSSAELVKLLGARSQTEGRTLLLKNEKTMSPSEPEEVFPDLLTINLPMGKLGMSFKGRRARIARIHAGSVLEDQLYLGMLIDTIEIPGGSTFSGLKASEASRILKDTSKVEGRILTLRGPTQTELLALRDDDALDESGYSQSQRN
eukprot:CAMPEP_0178909954 /NCGR_PEP_ID=MMETSP0786-20121207/8824_1 /TAXON_ID=186022 /ORGANISM="Thalassionema frauenfeldii, Strain CCMP 1798" /LENGTH=1038 /DNA_ID=CAMNT_0020582143 /DNA_START=385 /DNA_END=3501 /DNA_ORIENTATION=-